MRSELAVFRGLACLGLVASAAGCGVPDAPREVRQSPGGRPSSVPDDFVVTPNGWFHPSCLVQVDPEERVRDDGVIEHRSGRTRTAPPCTHPHYDKWGVAKGPDAPSPSQHPTIGHAWIESVSNDRPLPPVQWTSAQWRVPQSPVTQDNQTVYYFPGLEDWFSVQTILQPVLGWNSDFQNAWGIASWNCCLAGTQYESAAVRVNPGDLIYGWMNGYNCSGGVCANWQISIEDATTGGEAVLDTSSFGQTLNWYFGGALEVYNITTCTDYPANGQVTMSDVLAQSTTGAMLSIPWSYGPSFVGNPNCGQSVSWTSSSVVLNTTPLTFEAAFQASTTALWTTGALSGQNSGLGMMPGTSPSIAEMANGATEQAFQANTGRLWVAGTYGTYDTGLGMMPGTSPAITGLWGGGFQVAFQANTGSLWVYGSQGTRDTGFGMARGTSPSIRAIGTGYEVAFQANTTALWVTGSAGTANTGLGMMPGTSPSLTGLWSGGYEVAFQANTGHLWVYGSAGTRDWGLGMRGGSSPSITPIGGSYQVAFEANTGNLWVAGVDGTYDTGLGMALGTSPSIVALSSGFQTAFQANTGHLWVYGTEGAGDTGLGMAAGTSPSIGGY